MEIPIANLLLLFLLFLVIGGVVMMLFQYLLFIKYANLSEEDEKQNERDGKYTFPLQTERHLNTSTLPLPLTDSRDNYQSKNYETPALTALNFIMQFLFHEFKNSNRVLKWFYRKLTLELDELITKTTAGKLLDKLTIRELELGSHFPDIKSLSVHNIELDHTEQRIETLDLILEIYYLGNFSTSIDADMVLGNKGTITLRIKQLTGTARLQFTRTPYTHWSIIFLGDPKLNLEIESIYQGRPMQPNITNLISNQIRKAILRKHTLPNYKVRHKPIFDGAAEEKNSYCDIQPNGLLTVRFAELSRLIPITEMTDIYCTITLAPIPFIEAHQKDNRHIFISLDVIIHKARNQPIGIVFKQSNNQVVRIHSVLPDTPADKSNLLADDAIMSIEGKPVTSIQQLAKLIKTLQFTVFHMRIKRALPGIIRSSVIMEDMGKSDNPCDLSLPSVLQPLTLKTDIRATVQESIIERRCSNESIFKNPTNPQKKTIFTPKVLKKKVGVKATPMYKIGDKATMPLSTLQEKSNTTIYLYQHSTEEFPFKPLILMEDFSNFELEENSRFLNVCVFGKCAGEKVLLGYNNIHIAQVLLECSKTSLNQCLKKIGLKPVKSHWVSNQSEINPNLRFGDVLFDFGWIGNPNISVRDTTSQ